MIFNPVYGLGPPSVSYSGDYTTKSIVSGGKEYTLYTFTGSGTLTIKGRPLKNVDLWACGGGGTPTSTRGGAGGFFAQVDGQKIRAGAYAVAIGAANGETSLSGGGKKIISAAGAVLEDDKTGVIMGGSGGGTMGTNGYQSRGMGVSTRPFGDSVNFTSLPCAGGGGSAVSHTYGSSSGGYVTYWASGGDGGSNGSDGHVGTVAESESDSGKGGKGGATGGGSGSGQVLVSDYYDRKNVPPTPATYYGSGGGGFNHWMGFTCLGVGYQGVMFMRVPV